MPSEGSINRSSEGIISVRSFLCFRSLGWASSEERLNGSWASHNTAVSRHAVMVSKWSGWSLREFG